MPRHYENRKGDTYYLQQGRTRTGAPKYYMGRKLTGEPLETPPEGYEIYESPENAQMFVRKVKPSRVLPSERELLAAAIRQRPGLEHVIVDVEDDSLVVYLPGMSSDKADDLVMKLAGPFLARLSAKAAEHRERLIKQSVYTKMFRFALRDADRRLFSAERWCFRGAIDDWIGISGPRPLGDLIKAYVKHLGQESFFELM